MEPFQGFNQNSGFSQLLDFLHYTFIQKFEENCFCLQAEFKFNTIHEECLYVASDFLHAPQPTSKTKTN